MRTALNGVEGSFAVATLYYFFHMKPKCFDRATNKLTALITISFLTRSSSLIPWVPIALLRIAEQPAFFLPIVVAALTVAIPLMAGSILLDSLFYGRLCMPQLNFLYFNVVENISKHFGTKPREYYMREITLDFTFNFNWSVISLVLFSFLQITGRLHHYSKACKDMQLT